MKYSLSLLYMLVMLFCVNNIYSQELIISNDTDANKAIELAKKELRNLELDKCLDHAEKLLNYSLKNKKYYFSANAYNLLGLCYEELRDLKKAEVYYLKAIYFAKLSDDNRFLNIIYSNIANFYFYHEIDKYKAILNYEIAYDYAVTSNDSIDIVYSKIGLVQVYFDIDKINIGYKHLMDVKDYIEAIDDSEFNILFYTLNGSYYREIGNFNLAESNYLKAATYLDEIDVDYEKSFAVDIYFEIYDFYKENKQYDLALKFLEKHDKIEDDLANKGRDRQIKILGTPIEARLSNLKIQKIEAEKKLQDIELQKTNLFNRIIIIIIVFMLIIIIIILVYTYLTKKYNKELKVANKALKISMQKAEEANEIKSKFIATITHELRTPLYGVIGITNILGNDYKELKDSQHLKSLEFSAKYLLQLVNDVLIMSKIDDTEIQLQRSAFNLRDELETILNSLQLIAIKNNNELTFNPIEPLPEFVESDKIRLSQIIINLISNSLKFTKDGKVSLEVEQTNSINKLSFITFKVKDNGIGIPKELHEKVFDKFVQIERKEDDYQGTGLGLTIVKKLVNLFDGTMQLESQENIGTTISFTIPFTVIKDKINQIETEYLIGNFDEDIKVLVVEDNKINQVVTRKILESKNLFPIIVDDGYKAIELLKTNFFDIILMDINMPIINGIETTKIIREKGITIPIIAVTAFERDQISEDIYSIGFNDIIIKPFNSSNLYEILHKHIAIKD